MKYLLIAGVMVITLVVGGITSSLLGIVDNSPSNPGEMLMGLVMLTFNAVLGYETGTWMTRRNMTQPKQASNP